VAPAAPDAAAAPDHMPADVQWLRVIAMLVVFAIHAAEPFNPWDAWHIMSPERSKWLGAVVFFPAPWIMPLFMFLAGESAWHALERHSGRDYVRGRLLRIGLPLVAGILVLVPPQVWLERRLRGEFEGSFLEFYPRFFDGIYPRGNLSWHHLWFLVFLLVFAVVTLPLFQWLRGPRGRRLMARLGALCDAPLGLLWLLAPAVAVRLAIPLLFPGFLPLAYDWSDRELLLPAFVAGFVFEGEPRVRRAVDRHWRAALAVALTLSAGLLGWAWPGNVLARLPLPRSLPGLLLWGAFACAGAAWVVALVGGARRHLTRGSDGLAHASELAYPFYVLHHGIIVAVAFAVVQWRAPLLGQVLVVALASFLGTAALCGIVASSGTLRLLFGLRARRRARAVADNP
jgi:glucan biosynthesis protein C